VTGKRRSIPGGDSRQEEGSASSARMIVGIVVSFGRGKNILEGKGGKKEMAMTSQ